VRYAPALLVRRSFSTLGGKLSAQQVIDEALPMLDDMLGRIGIHRTGTPIDFTAVGPQFSAWLQAQDCSPADVPFLISLVGAFLSEYLIDRASAVRHLEGKRILLRLPIASGVAKEFDPYASAVGIVTNRSNLEHFLQAVAT
jgi:hypothetical protein